MLTVLKYASRKRPEHCRTHTSVQQLYKVNLDSSWEHAQQTRNHRWLGQCNISLECIPGWLWKCKHFEVSKHGEGWKMWGNPGSVSKSFLAAWHLRCNEVRWSIRTLALLCELTPPLYQSWSIKVSKRYFSQKSSRLLETAQGCGPKILSSWMTISR